MSQQSDPESPYSNIKIQQEIGKNQGQVIGQIEGSVVVNTRNFTIQRNGGSSQAFDNSYQREVPSLLPYLANRSFQEFELGNVLQNYLKQVPIYPLVCIIHGDEFQSHYKFVERLQKRSLSKFLGFDSKEITIKKYQMDWPSTLKNFNDSPAWLRKNLADSVLGDSFASLERINQVFCQYSDPVIVHTNLLTEDWKNQGFKILENLLDFWQDWPDLNPNQKLIVCLCIKYQFVQQKYFFKKGFFIRRQFQHINKKVHEQLATLSKTNFRHFNRIFGVVLQELKGIGRADVEAWADSEETMEFLGEAAHEKMITEIREIFENQELISMEHLAEALIVKLKSLQEPKRSLL